MKIAIKTQTARATNYKEGLNCVNLFLQDRVSNTKFQVGLQVTEWGDTKPIEPIILFEIDNKEYRLTIPEIKGLLSAVSLDQ